MGWNSWNFFTSNISESLLKATADAMVSSGMKDAGYRYINIDDTWSKRDRENGRIVPDPQKFPSGMKALADYVHERGLKLGIYGDRGTRTCADYPGSYNNETIDAQTFAEWGIDYLKYDNCYIPDGRDDSAHMREDYTRMRQALDATGREIMFSICAWWFYDWMPEVGHLARTTTDIVDMWSGARGSMIGLLNANGGDKQRYGETTDEVYAYDAPGLAQYAHPGYFNDPDMLEVGNGGMSDTEYRAHFSLWAIMAAPLIAGNDLRNMSNATRDILTNTEVIAVDQDPLGVQGTPISTDTQREVWVKKLTGDKTYAVVLFNRTTTAADITVRWSDISLGASSATVRDLWAHQDLGAKQDQFTANVPGHGVVMIRVVGQ